MRKIITEFVHPPIPIRNRDWCAYYENEEENKNLYGHGKTEQEAILNLLTITEEPYNDKINTRIKQ